MKIVVKIGTSSLTDELGNLVISQIQSVTKQIAKLREDGHSVVLVTSAAISAGKPALNLTEHPTDYVSLQALATIGQNRLLSIYEKELNEFDLVSGQILVTLDNFSNRDQYLRIRNVLEKLLELGVVPIVNENDAITDEEIRFGDNDRLAAMMAHLMKADLLVLLTDKEGIYTSDPSLQDDAVLIKEIDEISKELEQSAGASVSKSARGGMASKLAAARIASLSGIKCVIASSFLDDVLRLIVSGNSVGTVFKPKEKQLSARKLWIGFAAHVRGVIVIDEGATKAIVNKGSSLLSVGIVQVDGEFARGEVVEVKLADKATDKIADKIIAKGIVSFSSDEFHSARKAGEIISGEFIHRNDLVILDN